MSNHKMHTLGSSVRLAFLGAALGLAGCGANLSPVLNVQHAPVVGAPAGQDGLVFVHDAVLRAIAAKGWTVAGDAPGLLTASIQKDDISATVDISYSPTEFSIMRKDSSPSLHFDGTRIHKRYNFWIDRLRAQINAEIQKPHAGPATAAASPV